MTILQVCAYAAPYEGNFIKSLKALGKVYEEKAIKWFMHFRNQQEIFPGVKN